MSGMVDVIAAHLFLPRSKRCFCGKWDWRDFSAGTAPAHSAHVAEELAKAGFGNVQAAKRDALLELAESPEVLERARKRIEDELVEWRDAGRFMLRNNGLMIRNRDSTGSEIIRFGFEDGLRIALEAEAQFIAVLADQEGHNLVQAIHDRKAEGECGP